jgi:hypothetical protein
MAGKTATVTDLPKSETVKNPRNAAYSAAEKRLRETFSEEFQDYLQQECDKRGIDYKPRLTEEQKAAKAVAEAIAKFGPGILPVVEQVEFDEPDFPDSL